MVGLCGLGLVACGSDDDGNLVGGTGGAAGGAGASGSGGAAGSSGSAGSAGTAGAANLDCRECAQDECGGQLTACLADLVCKGCLLNPNRPECQQSALHAEVCQCSAAECGDRCKSGRCG